MIKKITIWIFAMILLVAPVLAVTTNDSDSAAFIPQDTYVRSNLPNNNYGSSTFVIVNYDGVNTWEGMFMLNITGIPVNKITDMRFNWSSGSVQYINMSFFFCNDTDGFDESVITYNNWTNHITNCEASPFQIISESGVVGSRDDEIDFYSKYSEYNTSVFVVYVNGTNNTANQAIWNLRSSEWAGLADRPKLFVTYDGENSNSTNNSEWKMSSRLLDNSYYIPLNLNNVSEYNHTNISLAVTQRPIASSEYIYAFAGNSVYQLDRDDLSIIASFNLLVTPRGMALAGDYLIATSTNAATQAYIFKLNASNISQQIQNRTPSPLEWYEDSITVYGNEIYVQSTDQFTLNGVVRKINLDDLTQVLDSFVTSAGTSEKEHLITDDYVYLFERDGSTKCVFRQLNRNDFSQVANFTTLISLSSTYAIKPIYAGDYVYFGCDNGLFQLNSSDVSQQIANFTGFTAIGADSLEFIYNDEYVYLKGRNESANHYIYQLNKSDVSQLINKKQVQSGGTIDPLIGLVAGDSLLVHTDNTNMLQLDSDDVTIQIGTLPINFNAPIYINNGIYVGNGTDFFRYYLEEVPLNITNYDFYPNQTTSGNDITFNATVTGDTDSVWVRIWQGITTIATKALSFISGDLWSGQIETNDSFIGISNVTFYANATNGTEINVTSLEQLNITANNSAPVIVINSPINNQKINTKGYVLDVNFTVTDDKDDIANCSLIVNGNINVTNSSISTSGTYIISTTLSGGKWEIKINCTDNDGATGDPPINITIPYEQYRTFVVDMNGLNYSSVQITFTGLQYNSTYPSNISIDLGSDLSQEWNYTGSLTGSTTATIPKTVLDNWIQNNCTSLPFAIYHDYCPIELLFKSDTQGSLNVSNITTTYQENTTNWPGGVDINKWLTYFNNTWLNNLTITALFNVSEINAWSQNNCTGEYDDFDTTISSFMSGILLLDDLEFTYVSNITPIEITNGSVEPQAVFPGQNVTINATVNISGAIYEVYAIQQQLYDGGFQNTNDIPGQNFTDGTTGWIARIDVFDVGGTTGNLTLSVYEGPGGTFMDSRTVTNYTDGWIIFDFGDDPLKVTPGAEYFFNLTSDGTNWNNLGYSNTSTYPAGILFINGTPVANQDLMFRVLIYDYWTDSVWVRIWTGITTWLTKALTYIGNNLWSTDITTNASWGSDVNVTIYANTTDGANATPYELNFTIINATYPIYQNVNVTPPSPQNYSPTQIYTFSVECISPYGIQNAVIEHNFTGTWQNYTMLYSGSGDLYQYTYTGITTGSWDWRITCKDIYNLTNTTSDYTYIVNKTYSNLQITIAPSATPSYIDTVTITCVSDSIESTKYMYMDSASITNPTVATFSTGNYFLECNQSESENYYAEYVNRTMTVIDVPPVVNLTAPTNGYVFVGGTTEVLLEFNVSDYDTTSLDVEVFVDNVSVTSFTTTDIENGYLFNVSSNTTYTWFVTVTDGNSLVESDTWNFTISPISADNPPTVNLIYPTNGADLASTFNYINYSFQLNDTDSLNLDYTLYVDNFARCSDSVLANAIYSCEIGPFAPNTSHCWFVNATDYTTMVQSATWCFTINDTCTPNWIPQYTSCLVTDQSIKYYIDGNSCGNTSTIPADNGTISTCDYCTPNFYCSAYHACTSDSIQTCAVVSDYNTCCAQTGLPDDCYSGNMDEFTQTCTYESALVVIPTEAGAIIAIFLQWITSPLGLLLLLIVCIAIMFAIGLIIASYIRNSQI